ncbi:MAG TPA: LysR substrate-binding domain-containing protein [Burkholderiales bacterium]|jgi:DNA-binding transcriptional LysR family regulator
MPGATDQNTSRRLSQLRFRHLELLVELGRTRSLRSSAAAFGVTQPALSRSLSEIEAAFGAPLFRRSARGVEPTPAGEIAIRGAALLLEELGHVRDEAALGEQAGTLLRLGATPFLAQGYLPPRIAALGAREPTMRIQLAEGDIPGLIASLSAGRLDAVLCPLTGGEGWDASLRYEPVFLAEFAVIAHKQHVLTRQKRVGWDVLAKQRWILPPPGTRMHGLITERFVRAGHPMPAAMVESGVPVTVVRLAAAGAGLAVVPLPTLSYLRAHGEVARLDVQPAIPGAKVGLVSRAGPVNPRVSLLRDMLRASSGDKEI